MWLALLLVLLASRESYAQSRCSAAAVSIARFTARAWHWRTTVPSAEPVATWRRGRIWRVTDNTACCGTSTCSGSSERADALIGVAGRRMFALSRERPLELDPTAPRSHNASAASARGWSGFLAASGPPPANRDEAMLTARRVIAGFWPDLTPLDAPPGADPSDAVARAGGWDVVCWMGARGVRDPAVNFRETSAGLASYLMQVRLRVRIGRNGSIRLSR